MSLKVVYTPIPVAMEDLWHLSPDDFNRWRMQNDVPLLIDFFYDLLPRFEDWAKEHSLSKEDLIRVTPTGDILKGKNQEESFYTLYEKCYTHPDRKAVVLDSYFNPYSPYCEFLKTLSQQFIRKAVISKNPDEPINSNLEVGRTITLLEQKRFTPYFSWYKQKFGKDDLTLKNIYGNRIMDIGGWLSPDMPEASRALLCGHFQMLKLGPTTLSIINARRKNLDFVDLDHSIITWMLNEQDISYSSCRKLNITQARIDCINFHGCNIDELDVNSSSLNKVKFINCTSERALFTKARLLSITFDRTSFNSLDFDRTDILQVNYVDDEKRRENVAENLRIIRAALQSSGNRNEARKIYFQERSNERKLYYSLIRKTSWITWNAIKDKYKYSWKWIVSYLENILWGYGERPARTMWCSVGVISSFSVLYFLSSHKPLSGNIYGSIFFSIMNFFNLGYGDITVQDIALNWVMAFETAIGIILMGLFVAGFANRSQY